MVNGRAVAVYAVQERGGRGRLHAEEEAHTRTPWQRDRDRVIHSRGFRTLQYKTQVFVNHEGDFFRTRLTHSLEVAQIARSIARQLNLDEDLTEALALAHDLGHTPFGHAGEDALKAAMATLGGFDHNTQSIRLVTLLEGRYFAFDGLNLTWETLEGLAKHNGPVRNPTPYMAEYAASHDLMLHTHASAEAQVAAMADDIAYHGHDLDDGIRAGLLGFDDLEDLPLVGAALAQARARMRSDLDPGDAAQRLRHEMVRHVINALASDLTTQTRANLATLKPQSADDIRLESAPVVSFSPEIARANAAVRTFLYARVYRHWRVNRMTRKARLVTRDLFDVLYAEPNLLPDPWRGRAEASDDLGRARIVADHIASMTDRFAMEEHRRLTELSALG